MPGKIAQDSTPLFDPRILDPPEFFRNPYPFYRILRDHYPAYHDKLHNTCWVTRYGDINNECYFDAEGFNTIPKGSLSGVLGFPKETLSRFFYRYDSMMTSLAGSATHQQGVEARQDVEDYIAGIIKEPRRQPTYLYDNDGNPISKDIIIKLCEGGVTSFLELRWRQ